MTLPKKQRLGSTDGEQTPELNLPVTKFVYPERKSMRSNGLRYLPVGMWIKIEGREKLKRRKKPELIVNTETACRMDQARPRNKTKP